MDNIIEVRNLKKYYNNGDVKALDDVSFSLKEGKVYGLIGENGAGKTTLVKLLLGGINPTDGHASIHGERAGSVIAKEKIGYIYEGNALPLNENPFEYLLTLTALSDLEDDKSKILELIKHFELEKFKYKPMKGFSSGMKKKVQIIAALLDDPSILILDEPTANLDPKARNEIFNFIKETVLSQKMTVILCSHNLLELEKIVDDIIMIRKGKLIVQGSYQEILKKMSLPSNRYLIKSDNNKKLISFLNNLDYTSIISTEPLKIETSDYSKLKEDMIDFIYKNRIFIEQMLEDNENDSLYEVFDYFNVEKGEDNDE